MQGSQLKAIRRQLGLTTRELGAAIGYAGTPNTISVTIRRYEAGMRPIPPWIARLAWYMGEYGVPPEWTVLKSIQPEN
jgi:transcriptional regulator with XRE-family HTH domain